MVSLGSKLQSFRARYISSSVFGTTSFMLATVILAVAGMLCPGFSADVLGGPPCGPLEPARLMAAANMAAYFNYLDY